MPLQPEIIENANRYDGELAQLRDYGLGLDKPGFVGRLREKQAEMAEKYAADRALCEAINTGFLPVLLEAYVAGNDADRIEIRTLLKECRHLRSSLHAHSHDQAEARLGEHLALMAMKDGDPVDWRDEILALDKVCRHDGLPSSGIAHLLRQAADLASDEPRGGLPSFRATLLERARTLEIGTD